MVGETTLRAEIDEILPGVIADRRYLHEHPELSFHEVETARFVAERLQALGLDDIRTGVGGTGVTALIRGERGEGKVAMVFSAFAGHNSTVNGRSFILIERESAKSTMAIILNTLQEAAFWYKYARSKFFTTLCIGRLGGHNAQAQTYQDVPLFSFTESDPIDWSKSIPEIDEQLIAHFGLEEHREYILSAAIPYARELGQEYLDRLEDGGVDTSGINDWY